MLVELALVMSVPTCTVEKIKVVRNLDKSHASLHEASGKQATLTKFTTVGFSQIGRLSLELESAHELWAG